ncbi:MAG: ABC transporter permease, partial [Deltaproteobacteria bacterium]|nr:ABC transporter permease [Deltaproteobacteria bacterium]
NIANYLTVYNITETSREFAEFGFVALAMTFVIISGGIDLSVGSIFAVTNFMTLMLFHLFGWPILAVLPAVLLLGSLMGACNGVLIGYLRTGAFLTTLVTLIIFRACVGLLDQHFSGDIVSNMGESAFLDFLGEGSIVGIPANVFLLVLIAAFGHIFLTRTRPGWHLNAIGGERSSARHAGIAVKHTVFLTYVASGTLTAIAGIFFAARLASMNADTGQNWEMLALTAVVMGGVSLSGGKGSVTRALIGATIIMILTNGLLRMGISGSVSRVLLGGILLFAVGIDSKWVKNRYKMINKMYVVPAYNELRSFQDIRQGKGSVYEINNRLNNAEAIGLNQVEGPEDIILDRDGRLYGACRQGKIIRFSGENFETREVFCQMGGRPLGMAFDRDDNLILCNGGMGLYGVRPDGTSFNLTDETNRSWWKLRDDSRLRLADDLDIAPDGKIYFSEATERYEMHTWMIDALESRGNGRIICYDPKTDKTRTIIRNLMFPNGICTAHDGESFFFAETWNYSIKRHWIAGSKKGQTDLIIGELPGCPDNINRASDGNYWVALVGVLTPSFNLSLCHPSFRTRMVKRTPSDEWLLPNINRGCVVKFSADGNILDALWDSSGVSHPVITSMREDRGYLYLGGIYNNRIGRVKLLDEADPNWFGPDSYWKEKCSNKRSDSNHQQGA